MPRYLGLESDKNRDFASSGIRPLEWPPHFINKHAVLMAIIMASAHNCDLSLGFYKTRTHTEVEGS